MENSYLNLAHFHSRKADNHLRYRRFDEAIECHQKSAEFLEETMKMSTMAIALESLRLQKEFHLKQRELIRIKKLQYEKYKVAIDHQTQKHSIIVDKDTHLKSKTENSCQLQLAIYKTMEEADSLLEILGKKGSDTDSLKSIESEIDDKKRNNELVESKDGGNKKPKDESIMIEELRTLNHQLHIMVFQLVTQLDDSIQEADTLRDKVQALEKEKLEKLPYQLQNENIQDIRHKSTRNVDESPSSGDISPAQELTPLDLPVFDFDTFSSKHLDPK